MLQAPNLTDAAANEANDAHKATVQQCKGKFMLECMYTYRIHVSHLVYRFVSLLLSLSVVFFFYSETEQSVSLHIVSYS